MQSCDMEERRVMNEWEKYLDIISQFKGFKYTKIYKVPISLKKWKWVGGVYWKGQIYSIPNAERTGLCINPIERNYNIIGCTKVGTFKWTGGCVYKEKIYGFPRKESSILVIDPGTREMMEEKLDCAYRGEHHYGGICTDKGIVYQPPRDTDHILKVDLNDLTTEEILITKRGEKHRYTASIEHPDGSIYMIPEAGRKVLRVHPITEEIETIGDVLDAYVFGVVVGLDGNIYGYCNEGRGILKIDVIKKQVSRVCEEIGEASSYGSVVGLNGKIYNIPAHGNYIWEFDIEKQSVIQVFCLKENGIAKCAGAGIGHDGTICMIPASGEYIYYLSTEESVDLDEAAMNNRFFNTAY